MNRLPLSFLLLPTFCLLGQEPAPLPPVKQPLEQATLHARQATEAMRRSDWIQAKDQWELLLKIQPESSAAYANLGMVENRLKDLPNAIKHLEKAVQLKPELANAWLTLGMIQLEQNQPLLACHYLTRAAFEAPTDPQPHNSLAVALKKMGWTKGAELELQKSIDLDPVNPNPHFNLALLYMDLKPPQEESARRHYLRAKQLGAAPDELLDKQLGEQKPAPAPEK
jgi:Flp pilus assembly protein TadD